MSGGHFDYKQYDISHIIASIQQLIYMNNSKELNQWGDTKGAKYTSETILEFERAVELLQIAETYVQRIDWLVSGDDNEENFHSRLKSDLGAIK